jgi:hypothetical protein
MRPNHLKGLHRECKTLKCWPYSAHDQSSPRRRSGAINAPEIGLSSWPMLVLGLLIALAKVL